MERKVPFWMAARTHGRREVYAAYNVRAQHYEAYVPIVLSQFGPEPLFPCYIFVRTDGPFRFLFSTYGMVGPVMQGPVPGRVPDSYVCGLKEMENSQGLINLPMLNGFAMGDPVTIQDGPFAGRSGLYRGQTPDQRVSVLLTILGRSVKATVDTASLRRV